MAFTKKILSVILAVLFAVTVFAVDELPTTLTITQHRPQNYDHTIYQNIHRPFFFIDPQGTSAYDPRDYPAEKGHFKFYGTLGFYEYSIKDPAVRADAKASQDIYFDQRRNERIQQLQEFYGFPLAREYSYGEEPIVEEGYVPKFPHRPSTNYLALYTPFPSRYGMTNIWDEINEDTIRSNALARLRYNQERYRTYLLTRYSTYDPYRVATNIFTYSGNVRLQKRQLGDVNQNFAPYTSPVFLPYDEMTRE
ncbi:hypothetical protein J4457_00200 [Candidatus Woesearchaeota archaeon]|nr:hypothetical protein [Candidatus Woesearchaeota archaeon]